MFLITTFLGLERVICIAVYANQKALEFHQNYLNLCSEYERSFLFGTTWGWVINDRIFILDIKYNRFAFAQFVCDSDLWYKGMSISGWLFKKVNWLFYFLFIYNIKVPLTLW